MMEITDSNEINVEVGRGDTVHLNENNVIESPVTVDLNGSEDVIKHESNAGKDSEVSDIPMIPDSVVSLPNSKESSNTLIQKEAINSSIASKDNDIGKNLVVSPNEEIENKELNIDISNEGSSSNLKSQTDDTFSAKISSEASDKDNGKPATNVCNEFSPVERFDVPEFIQEINTGLANDSDSSEISSDSSTPGTFEQDDFPPLIGNKSKNAPEDEDMWPIIDSHKQEKYPWLPLNKQFANSNMHKKIVKIDDPDFSESEGWVDILGSGHIMKKVLKAGIPNSRPQKSDICTLNIIGRLENGYIFENLENIEISLSDYEVIQGLDFAIALMDMNEEAEIRMTPRFGYGTLGNQILDVPAKANLIYLVSLLNIREAPPVHSLSISERINQGIKKKARGNWWYNRYENTIAINCYRRALDYFDDTEIPEPHSDEDLKKLLDERLKTYNNLGTAQTNISALDAALISFGNVLTAQPGNIKALYRKAKALRGKGNLSEAIDVVTQALTFTDSFIFKELQSSLMRELHKENNKERELYKKMMKVTIGRPKQQPPTADIPKNIPKNNYRTFTLVAAISFAVAVLGTIVVKYKF